MRLNFTDKILTSLVNTRQDKDSFQTDVTGLGVAIRPSSNQNVTKNKIFFRFKRTFKGQSYNITLGTYPSMSLNEARQKYLEILMQLEQGKFSTEEEKKVKFAELWKEFCDFKFTKIKEATQKKYHYAYNNFLHGLDGTDVEEINPDTVLSLVEKQIGKKKYNSVEFVVILLKSFLDYAVFKKVIAYNPLTGMTKFLPKQKHEHYKAFRDETMQKDMTELFSAISELEITVQATIYMYFFTLLRNTEIRTLQTSNYFGDYLLVKTKTLDEFKVPLYPRAKEIIDMMIARKKSAFNDYIFEGKAEDGILSCNTINKALKSVGFGDRLKVHGIRSCGRQWLQTMPTAKESIIELCLSHVAGNTVQQAYNRGDYYTERQRILFEWCKFVESCAGENLLLLLQKGKEKTII